jgi:hypothetical protein
MTIMTRLFPLVLVAMALMPAALPAQPQGNGDEALVDQVRKAINKGVSYLKNAQKPHGAWEDYPVLTTKHPGGTTAMAVLALLNAGVPADDDVIKKGLTYLSSIEDTSTYARALQTMAFVECGKPEYLERINNNVKHLLAKAIRKNGKLVGWNYDHNNIASNPDNSNTQYALLALWVAKQSGIEIPAKFWEEVRDFYTRIREQDGGWSYSIDGDGGAFGRGSTLTMTAAGVCGLLMAQMELNAARMYEDPVKICGKYDDEGPLGDGLKFIGQHFKIDLPGRTFYNLYGIERLGRLSGMRFLGAHDWYREGCSWLVQKQDGGGYWQGTNWDHMTVVSTSYAVLFLSKGRTPVLISKLAHGNVPRQGKNNDQDWDRRRNDLRHLVDYASKVLFEKKPLAWQNFDMMRAGLVNPKDITEVTSDLLQSPIVYITGHDDPNKRLKESEKEILKKYVENGGVILAVACCGAGNFDKGFHDLCEELFKKELQPLEPEHAVWNMKFEVKPGAPFALKGIQQGCKTVLIYCPQNLCGYWELNRKSDKAEGETAFQLGANIIAYATGLEPPKPRLTKIEVAASSKDDPKGSQRNHFQIGQLISNSDSKAKWMPAPEAMQKLAENLRDFAGVDVITRTAVVPIDSKDLTSYKFLYMHGRHEFKFSPDELVKLRFNLQNGGLLFADACCGKEAFDKAFRQFIIDLFPKAASGDPKDVPRLEEIPADDALFSKTLNGEALTDANIQIRLKRGEAVRQWRPLLEGVKIGKRWVVIYSKYDIGCALERHQSADCRGYSYESALRIGRAAVLYQLTP